MKRFFLPLVVFGLAAGLYSAGVLVPLENGLAAINFKLNRRTASRDLVVVAIDPTSLDRLPIWPWPRSYHAAVIENLLAAGARRVGLDIDFSSRSSLEEDQVLENTVEKVGQKVILPAFLQWEEQPDGPALLRESLPLPSLRAPATLASINVQPDPDGLVRWYGSPQGESASRFPSLAAVLEGADGNRSRSFQVDFSIDPGSVPRLSYVDVLTGQFDTDLVRDRNVIIGATSLELGDQVTVPVHATIAGILLQALAFESLHQGRALHGAGAPGELGLALLMALAAGPLMVRFSWRKSLALLSLLGGSSLALGLLILATNAVLLDTSPALLTACGCFAGGLLHRVDQQKLRLLIQERLLQRKSILMHHVMENSLDAILTLKEDSSIETCNQAAERMLGAPAGAIRGQPLSRFARMAGNGVTEGDTASSGRRGLHDGPLTKRPGEGLGFRWDGTSFPMEMVSSTFQVEDRVVRVVLLRDMTELRRQQEILQHQATHDDLTDLPNRVMLKDRLQEILAKAEEGGNSVAFLLLDLDQFKEVNDTLGHHVGDLLLRQVAARLRGLLKPPALMARLGGDEFGVLLPEADLESARNQAQAFLGALAQPFIVAQLSLEVGASIGIAMYPEHARESSALMRNADIAMYAAKRLKQGHSVYDQQRDLHSVRNLTLIGDLRRAVEKDELEMVYQPKMSCLSDAPVGLEALVRWTHPVHGSLPPDEFVGLAERTGLIRPLTRRILEKTLRQAALWRRQHLDYPIAVNLSALNLKEDDLPWTLRQLLDEFDLPAKSILLEITETVIMEDPQRAMNIVSELAFMGVKISIDDFGTGYSSLAYLRKLPAGELKIDRSFVMEMDTDREDTVIVRSIIEMAHNLGLQVVAEGVETEAAWQSLKKLGCDFGQGYFFSRPLPPLEITRWLRTHAAPPSGMDGLSDLDTASRQQAIT